MCVYTQHLHATTVVTYAHELARNVPSSPFVVILCGTKSDLAPHYAEQVLCLPPLLCISISYLLSQVRKSGPFPAHLGISEREWKRTKEWKRSRLLYIVRVCIYIVCVNVCMSGCVCVNV